MAQRSFNFGDCGLRLTHATPSFRTGMDHFAIAVAGFSSPNALRALRALKIEAREMSGEVRFADPDGIQVHLVSAIRKL